MNDRAYGRGVSMLAGVWAVIFTVAAILTEPMWLSAGISRFWLILILSVTWTVPAIVWTLVAVAARGADGFRRMISLAVNSLLILPMVVIFSTAAPFAIAALLAAGVNLIYVLASTRPGGGRRPLAFAAAAALEAGAALRLVGEPLLGVAVGAAGIAALVWLLPTPNARTSWRKSTASIAVALLIASWFAFTGRMAAAARAAEEDAKAAENPAQARRGSAPTPPRGEDSEGIGAGQFAGVILWPEVEPTTKLVAPLPVWTRASAGVMETPNSIPFSGEYWLFEPPHHRPPKESLVRRGKPTKVTFRSVDDQPLFMEAHQKLPMPVALRCCRAIEAEILNLDAHPGFVVLELFLVNGDARLSLGQLAARSRILRWEIPRAASMRQFDEIAIVFHREPLPLGFSAKLAIENFVLVP
jgi:hypothetical protein